MTLDELIKITPGQSLVEINTLNMPVFNGQLEKFNIKEYDRIENTKVKSQELFLIEKEDSIFPGLKITIDFIVRFKND